MPESWRKYSRFLTKDELEAIISKVFDYIDRTGQGEKFIVLRGGEPLLAKDLVYYAIDRFHREARIAIQTNRVLLTEEDVKYFRDKGVSLSISIDGPPPEAHDLCRHYWDGRGSFTDIERALELIQEYDYQNVGTIVTITRYNMRYLAKILEFLDSHGTRSALFNPVMPSNSGALELMPDHDLLLKHYREVVQYVFKRNLEKSEDRFVVNNVQLLLATIIFSDYRPCHRHTSPCGAAHRLFVVTSSGDVYPCSDFIQFPEFRCGNILREEIEQILNSKPAEYLRRRHVNAIPECSQCPFKLTCCAPCPAAVYFLEHNLFRPSPYCRFFHSLIESIFEYIAKYGETFIRAMLEEPFVRLIESGEPILRLG